MAHLNKDQYSRRNENAAQRMIDNSQVSTLSDEQHAILKELCSIRHEIHCNQQSLYYTEHANFERFWSFLNSDGDGHINARLANLSMPTIQFNAEIDMPNLDSDKSLGLVEEGEEESHLEEALANASQINSDIEDYLRSIDNEHGTNYCPSGALRNF